MTLLFVSLDIWQSKDSCHSLHDIVSAHENHKIAILCQVLVTKVIVFN